MTVVFVIFMAIRRINFAKKKEAKAFSASAVLAEDIVLLRKIRDSLKKQSAVVRKI